MIRGKLGLSHASFDSRAPPGISRSERVLVLLVQIISARSSSKDQPCG